MHLANRAFLCALACAGLSLGSAARAELAQVTVGGEIRIRGEHWRNAFYPSGRPADIANVIRIPADVVLGRPTGDVWRGRNVVSYFKWGNEGEDLSFIQQRTVLSVRADFSGGVSALIELENWGVWGDGNFRSNPVTGLDARGSADNGAKIDLYQAYIEACDLWGAPLRLRAGRQELILGSGWLVGNNTNYTEFRGLSFDGLRLTYDREPLAFDAFYTKIAERSATLGSHQDADFMGLYGSYTGLDDVAFDAYWLWLRDSIDLDDTRADFLTEWVEDRLGFDDYGTTNLHTLGLRAGGTAGNFDFEAEAAYQLGDADFAGVRFTRGNYGDDGARFGAFGANLEAGYTLDVKTQPRFFVHGAFLGGEDNRDLSFREWLNPLHKAEASVSFNRLFSNKVYSPFLDESTYLSNVWLAGAGVQLQPVDPLRLEAKATYFQAIDNFDLPLNVRFRGDRLFYGGPLSFLTTPSDKRLGWDLSLSAAYHYTKDLVFRAGYSHFFLGTGLEDGNYVDLNGLAFNGASDKRDDGDYFFIETQLEF